MEPPSTDMAILGTLRLTRDQQDQLRKYALSPQGKIDVINSVDQIGNSASEIEHTFREVTKALIQAEGFDTEFRGQITKRREEWTKIHKTYSELLVDSCDEAGKLRSAIELFLGPFLQSILNNKNSNLKSKQTRLAAFEQRIKDSHRKATEFRNKFVNLKMHITQVQTHVESIIDQCKGKIQKKKAKVAELESSRDLLHTLKTVGKGVMIVATGLGSLLTGVCITGALCSLLCPPILAAWLVAAGACATVTVALDVIAGCGYVVTDHCIKTNEEKLNEAKDAITKMGFVVDALNPLPHSMELMSDRLRAFEGAWAAILRDINTIQTNLDNSDLVGWETTLETTDPVCKVLIEALSRYEVLVIR